MDKKKGEKLSPPLTLFLYGRVPLTRPAYERGRGKRYECCDERTIQGYQPQETRLRAS